MPETKTNENEIGRQIWRLHNLAAALEDEFERLEGEVTDETETLEEFLDQATDETLEGLAQFVAELDGRLALIKAEADRLAAVKARQNKRRAWALDVVRTLLERRGLKAGAKGRNAVEIGSWRLSLNKSPATLVGEGDPALLDDEFVREIPADRVVDKNAIKAAIKAGRKVDGFSMVRGPDRVGIK